MRLRCSVGRQPPSPCLRAPALGKVGARRPLEGALCLPRGDPGAAARAGSCAAAGPQATGLPSSCSYLCFESSKSGSSKRNKVIKLMDITDIQKVSAGPRLLSSATPFRFQRREAVRPEAGGRWLEVRCVRGDEWCGRETWGACVRAPLLEGPHAEPPAPLRVSAYHGLAPCPHGSAPGTLPQMGKGSTARRAWPGARAPANHCVSAPRP